MNSTRSEQKPRDKGVQLVSTFTQKLLNQGLQWGMQAAQFAFSHPTLGPVVVKAIQQLMALRAKVQETRESLLKKLQLASYQEQKELRRQIQSLEKKLERLERRIKDLQERAAKSTESETSTPAP